MYCVVLKSIGEIMSPFISDFIVREIDFGECLHEKIQIRISEIKLRMLTSLYLIASARDWTPSSPILFQLRSNVVSVCVKK